MKNPSDEEVVPCDDCPNPGMCITYCRAKEELKEDTAKVRTDLPKDFWEDH